MRDRLVLLGRELLLAGPPGDVLGVGARLAAPVDRGQHDPVAGVVEQGQAPAEVPADVAEGVVPDHREVPQRVAGLHLERGDLLPQPVHVLGQGVGLRAPSGGRRTTQGDDGEHEGEEGEHEGDRGEDPHGADPKRAAETSRSRHGGACQTPSRDVQLLPAAPSPGARRIAYQGEPGANSHLVCQQAYPDWEAAAVRVVRGRLRGRRERRRRPGDDPDRQLDRRPGGRHPPLPADQQPAHRGRAVPAHPVLADGDPGCRRGRAADRAQPRARAGPVPRRDPRARPDARSSPATPPARPARWPRPPTPPRPRSPRRWPRRSTAWRSCATRSRTRSTTRRASSCCPATTTRRRAGRGRWSRPSCSTSATCRPRSTRRSAASPPTAST